MEYRACEGSDPAPKNLPSFDFARPQPAAPLRVRSTGGRNQSWGGFSGQGQILRTRGIPFRHFARVRDVGGGRAGSYENKLAEARAIAMREMQEEAARLGDKNGMLMVTVCGTAVTLDP